MIASWITFLRYVIYSCVVEYSTYEKAVVAQKLLKGKIGTNGLAGVNGSRRMRYYAAIKSGIMGKKYLALN